MLTFSAWIKQGDVFPTMNGNDIFAAGVNGDSFHYQSGDLFRHTGYESSAYWGMRDWNGKQHDPSAWKHIVVRFDTAQANEVDRSRLFINGVQVTVNHTYHTIALNYDMRYNHTADAHWIGALNSTGYFDGYMAEVHWIDGAIVSPNAFGEVGDYGEWKPKEYVVADYAAYGTNGYYLDFADSSHFGNDVSGNNNDWTDTGFGTHDQMLDTPTNNFCTWNPLLKQSGKTQNPVEGNLKHVCGSTNVGGVHALGGTMDVNAGKWYFEIMLGDTAYSHWAQIGIMADIEKEYSETMGSMSSSAGTPVAGLFGWGYYCNNANKVHGGESSAAMSGGTAFGSGVTTKDVMGIAFDMDAGKIWFAENNVWLDSGNPAGGTNPAWDDVSGNAVVVASVQDGTTAFVTLNCGQDSSFAGEKTAQGNQDGNGIGDFYYTPPSGFLAMCTSNLPDPAVVPNENFNTVLYTGNGSTQNITGIGFQPDFTWIKNKQTTDDHQLVDAVRGVTKEISSQGASAETTTVTGLTAFGADGFSLGAANYYNTNTETYVAWNWKANGAGSANTDGNMAETVTVSANVDAGFSIVTFTGDGAAGTVGHGLSKAPEFICVKNMDDAYGWLVFNSHINHVSDPETDRLMLHTTNITADDVAYWNDTAPTADVFTVGTDDYVNRNDDKYVAYCWHSVAGYSKFGMYVGNDNADGPMINVGFRPRLVIIKITYSGGNDSWMMYDTAREPYNHADSAIFADTAGAESTSTAKQINILSNGFKVRGADGAVNDPEGSGGFYIYMAWAEVPFKYANAR